MADFEKNIQYYKFCAYGFLKNLRFFEAFFILFLSEKGVSYTQIGILYAVREITIYLLEIPSGFAADLYGRKKSLAGSFIFYMLSFVLFYFASGFLAYAAAIVLYGAGDSFRTGTHKGMIMDYLKINNWSEQKIAYYGHTRAWSQRGSAISSIIAGLIVFHTGSYQTIFIYSVIPYLINFLLILSYPNEIDLSESKNSKRQSGFSETFKIFFQTIKNRKVIAVITSSAVHSAYLKAIKDYIQPLMAGFAVTLPLFALTDVKQKNGLIIGALYFLIYLMNSYASVSAGKIAKRGGDNLAFATLVWGFSAGALAGVFYNFELFAMAIAAFVVIYLVENMRKPILTGYVADRVSNDVLVSVISVQSQVKTIITSLIAFVFGVLADLFGIGFSLIVTSLVLIAISVLLQLKFNEEKN